MINLLSPESKQQIRAARRNVTLRRYVLFIGCVASLVCATFGVGYYLTLNERASLQAEIDVHADQTMKYKNIRSTGSQFTKDLATAKQVLSHEVLFSQLLLDITKLLPPGVVLSDLNLSTDTFGTEVTIKARAKDAELGPLKLKAALEQSDLFSNVKIANINQKPAVDTTSLKYIEKNYPVDFQLLATISPNAGKPKTVGATQ